MLREYWRFYWPLALSGGVMVFGGQFQNGVLARYPEAVTELAVYALASGIFGLLHAGINFVSQMSNVYARSPHATRSTLKFILAISGLMTALMLILAYTSAGPIVIGTVYDVEPMIATRIVLYLELFAPLMLIDGARQFLLGLLVQNRMTGRLTFLRVIELATTVAVLIAGFSLGFGAPYVLVGAMVATGVLDLGLMYVFVRRGYELPASPEHEQLTYRELLAFFLPAATTGVMFAISRPVLYALIARTPDAITSIAAMRVGFDVATLFQVTANQFRHFFVTFGDGDLPVKRLFMAIVGVGITVALVLIAATPISTFILADLIGITGRVLDQAREILLLMCFLPGLILWRNYYHGLLMVVRRTGGMAMGGMARVGCIYLAAQACHFFGVLDYFTGTVILLLGFVLEATVVMLSYRRLNARARLQLTSAG